MTAAADNSLGDGFNFAQHLIGLNAGHPSKTAYIDDHGSLSYGELSLRIRKLAAALLALGIRREERVLLLMQDNQDWPVCFLGAMYAGIVPVAVNTLLTAEDYAYMLRNSRAQAVMVSAALKAFVKDHLAPYKYPRFIEFVDELPKTATGKIQRFRLRERERTKASAR
jgi:benzoate-CoA ligase